MNYKKIPYSTEWIEYPDLAPTFEKFGILPNSDGTKFTSPAVQFIQDGIYVMDSKNIARELERRFPAPSPTLYLDSPYVQRMEEVMPRILEPLRSIWQPRVATNLLSKRSKEYFERTRSERLGITLVELAQRDTDEAWAKARPGFDEVAQMLKEHNEGPFVMGQELSYADIILVSELQFFKRIDEAIFQKAVEIDESFQDLYDACGEWLARSD